MYSVISVIVDSLPGNTKNRESTRSWTARVWLVHPWADTHTVCRRKMIITVYAVETHLHTNTLTHTHTHTHTHSPWHTHSHAPCDMHTHMANYKDRSLKPWPIQMHSYVLHYTFICLAWIIHMCDMTFDWDWTPPSVPSGKGMRGTHVHLRAHEHIQMRPHPL